MLPLPPPTWDRIESVISVGSVVLASCPSPAAAQASTATPIVTPTVATVASAVGVNPALGQASAGTWRAAANLGERVAGPDVARGANAAVAPAALACAMNLADGPHTVEDGSLKQLVSFAFSASSH